MSKLPFHKLPFKGGQMILPFPEVVEKIDNFYTNLGEYCQKGCKGDCCQRSFWSGLTKEDAEFMFGGYEGIQGLISNKFAERDGELFDVYTQCQVFDPERGICTRHDDPRVPEFCRQYPLSEVGVDGITLTGNCNYVKKELEKIRENFTGPISDKVELV